MERVIEIVNYVMKQVLHEENNDFSEQELMNGLILRGYSQKEIEIAFQLLHSLPSRLKPGANQLTEFSSNISGYRVFSPAEKKKLTFACQGELIKLLSSSLISPDELEQVMVEAIHMGLAEIGLKELELILHKVITDEERLLMIFSAPNESGPCFLVN